MFSFFGEDWKFNWGNEVSGGSLEGLVQLLAERIQHHRAENISTWQNYYSATQGLTKHDLRIKPSRAGRMDQPCMRTKTIFLFFRIADAWILRTPTLCSTICRETFVHIPNDLPTMKNQAESNWLKCGANIFFGFWKGWSDDVTARSLHKSLLHLWFTPESLKCSLILKWCKAEQSPCGKPPGTRPGPGPQQ